VKKLNDVDFQFKLLDSMKIHLLIHVPYWNFAMHLSFQVFKSLSLVEINGENKYEMEEILDLTIWNTSFIGKVTM